MREKVGRESGGVYRVKRKFHCVVKRDAVGWVSRSRSRERERERERARVACFVWKHGLK